MTEVVALHALDVKALDVVREPASAPVESEATVMDGSFVDGIVQRVCAEFGAAPQEVRSRADELVRGFATARVRAFVPILVEKRLRETYRLLDSAERTA